MMGAMSILLVALVTVGDARQESVCARGSMQHLSVNTNSDDDSQKIKWETRECKGTMEIEGKVRLAGDLSGFESISSGGKVFITARHHGDKRELTLTPTSNGFAYVYEVNGDRRKWDNEGKAWLTSILALLVHHSAFAADERVDYLLRERGVNGVLQEVGKLSSDWSQRMYLTKLLEKATLNSAALESVLKVAAREIESDYEHRQLLSAVLKKGGLRSEGVVLVLNTASHIDSDYERAQLLIDVASRVKLDQQMRSAYLTATREIDSDYEKRRVFTALMKQGDLSSSDLTYVAEAASAIDSDYELRLTLMSVLSAERVNAAAIDAVLASARELDSDYELSTLLTHMLSKYTLTAEQRRQVIRLTEGMSSDHERGRVSAVLVRQMN